MSREATKVVTGAELGQKKNRVHGEEGSLRRS